jgi:hypothetical protein
MKRVAQGAHPATLSLACGRYAQTGSVLDVEITILDKQSKGVPIDEQANDDVVHLATPPKFEAESATSETHKWVAPDEP